MSGPYNSATLTSSLNSTFPGNRTILTAHGGIGHENAARQSGRRGSQQSDRQLATVIEAPASAVVTAAAVTAPASAAARVAVICARSLASENGRAEDCSANRDTLADIAAAAPATARTAAPAAPTRARTSATTAIGSATTAVSLCN